ncbi:MAG: metallophosphoesterase [Azospira oryzae]|jgi:Icc protein|nr:MAG: metallophosphoesterase [Azospira oryzae]
MQSRRKFFQHSALAGLASLAITTELKAEAPAIHQKRKRALRIAHITDVHILGQANAEAALKRVVEEINSLKDKPDLIINTGDTVMDENRQTREEVEARWSVWNRIMKSNTIPMRSALGNHDVWYGPDDVLDKEYKKDKRYGKQWAIEMLGLPHRYYSFESHGWQFIALDSINGSSGYQLDEEQLSWLKDELAHLPATRPVCVFNHVPIISMGPLMYETKRKEVAEVHFPSGDMHHDHQLIKDIFYQHKNVKLCLSGHVHYIDEVEYLGVKYLCNGAVSGNWWGNPIALDEFPPVYAIIDLYTDGSSECELKFYNAALQ